MNSLLEWSKSSVDYGRKLVDSAIEGAREGEGEFLREEPLDLYLEESVQKALAPAVIGACLGLVSGFLANGRRFPARTVSYGLVGGAIGLGAGLIWESRPLTARMASSAWERINKTRDEHWFEKNPIDYA